MTLNLVYWTGKGKGGGYWIDPKIYEEYVVKIPLAGHCLKRTGTIGLDWPQQYDLERKKGVCLVDKSTKCYYLIPRDVVLAHFVKKCDFNGVRNAILQYDAKKIVADGLVTGIPIGKEKFNKPQASAEAESVKKKFGL